jgi:hypothetical protein
MMSRAPERKGNVDVLSTQLRHMGRTVTAALVIGLTVLTSAACQKTAAGTPVAEGAPRASSSDDGEKAAAPVGEAKTLAPVCAVVSALKIPSMPSDVKFEDKQEKNRFGGDGPSQLCDASSFEESSFELTVQTSIHLGGKGTDGEENTGVEAVAEHIDTLRGLKEDGTGGEVIDVPPADAGYLAPQINDRLLILQLFKSNVGIHVRLKADRPHDQLLGDAKTIGLAVLESIKFG